MGYITDRQAEGIRSGSMMKIVCAFDIETWWDIRNRASRDRVSVAAKVRDLVEWGLEEESNEGN